MKKIKEVKRTQETIMADLKRANPYKRIDALTIEIQALNAQVQMYHETVYNQGQLARELVDLIKQFKKDQREILNKLRKDERVSKSHASWISKWVKAMNHES